jgi:hypothetical protein
MTILLVIPEEVAGTPESGWLDTGLPHSDPEKDVKRNADKSSVRRRLR